MIAQGVHSKRSIPLLLGEVFATAFLPWIHSCYLISSMILCQNLCLSFLSLSPLQLNSCVQLWFSVMGGGLRSRSVRQMPEANNHEEMYSVRENFIHPKSSPKSAAAQNWKENLGKRLQLEHQGPPETSTWSITGFLLGLFCFFLLFCSFIPFTRAIGMVLPWIGEETPGLSCQSDPYFPNKQHWCEQLVGIRAELPGAMRRQQRGVLYCSLVYSASLKTSHSRSLRWYTNVPVTPAPLSFPFLLAMTCSPLVFSLEGERCSEQTTKNLIGMDPS